MTLSAAIDLLLERIRREHYAHRDTHAWKRDERALMQAIARYGHECSTRGWYFEEAEIWAAINRLLDTMLPKRDQIRYLPIYLERAVDQHIRERAEELSDRAKAITTPLSAVRRGMQPAPARVVIQRQPVEVLSDLWRDLRRRHRARKTEQKPRKSDQLTLI